MTGPEHYREAERLAAQAATYVQNEVVGKPQATDLAQAAAAFAGVMAALSQAHAILAHTAAVAEAHEVLGDPPWDTPGPTWPSVAGYPAGEHTGDKPPRSVGVIAEQPGPLADVVGALMDRRHEEGEAPQARISDARAALAAVARWLGEQGHSSLGSRLLREPVPGVTP